MDALYSIFPARRAWPAAIDDVRDAPPDARELRLSRGARHIEALSLHDGLQALWCSGVDAGAFARICTCPSLESLYLENVKTEDLFMTSALSAVCGT
jgi:hypothetical protein